MKQFLGNVMVKLLSLSLFFMVLHFIACDKSSLNPDLKGDIALYSDNGVWDESVTATKKMFEWMDKSVVLVNADYINNNSLNHFSIICFPGGNMYEYSQDISASGKAKIQKFVRNGGGYIGICGGAYFASETVIWQGNKLSMETLNLFKGCAEGTINAIVPYPKYDMCRVNLIDTIHAISHSISNPLWMLYYWGPVFTPKNNKIPVLGNYAATNQPAILAFQYEQGKVFMIGTHPEIEEDSDRDGVVFTDTTINGIKYLGEDQLDDQASDWDLMKNVVLWCSRKAL